MRTAFSPVIYEVLDFAVAIYDRDVRLLAQAPSLPLFMGTMSFCVAGARRRGRRRGGARARRHHPLQLPLRHRLAPAGRGRRHARLPARRGADRLRGDQGPLARHRRQGAVLDRHRRRLPGGDDLPRRQAVLAAASSCDDIYRMALANSRVPKMVAGDINAEVVGVRTGRRGARCASSSATGSSVPRRRSSGCSTTARRSCAATSRRSPTAATSATGRWTTTASVRRAGAVRGRARGRRLDGARRLLARAGRAAGPDQLPARRRRSRRAASRSRCSPAAASRRTRGTSGRSRSSRGRARCSTRSRRRRASSTAGRRCRRSRSIYQALAEALPEAVPACSGGDICALVWWGVREETGEPWADGVPHPVGQGASTRAATAQQLADPPRPRRRRASRRPRSGRRRTRGCSSGSSSRPTRAAPGRHRGGLGVDFSFQLLEDATSRRRSSGRRRRRGGSPAAARRGRTASTTCSPTARSESLRQGDAAG